MFLITTLLLVFYTRATLEQVTPICSSIKSTNDKVNGGDFYNLLKCTNVSLVDVSTYYDQPTISQADLLKFKEIYLEHVPIYNRNSRVHQKNPIDFILKLNKKNQLASISWIRSNLSDQDVEFLLNGADKKYLGLRTLDLGKNEISQIRKENFANTYNLKKLHLSGNRITQLQLQCFSPLIELKELYLSLNPLQNLTLKIFHGLSSLTRLDLSNTSLTDLPRGVFEGLSALQHLNLANNRIYLLPFQVFRELKLIEELDLSHNLISTFLDNEFVLNRNLKMLNLRDNRISKISQHVFYGLQSLEQLDLSMNTLDTIDRNAFGTLENLKHLNLMNNKLAIVSPGLFAALKGIQSLKLSENPLVNLPDGLFSNQHQMNELIIENTNISRLNNWISRNDDVVNHNILSKLKYLSIRYNQRLAEIAPVFFKNLQYLEVLYLSDNALTLVPKEIGELNQLRLLDLSNNKLTHIPEQIGQLPLVRYLNLLHNDYACDCHMVWIVGWVEELIHANRSSPHELMRLSELKCRNGYPGDILRVLQHLNCIKPMLLESSSNATRYQLNETALLKCTLIGNPQPEIVWLTPWNQVLKQNVDADFKPTVDDPNTKYIQQIHSEFISDQKLVHGEPPPAGITVMENGFLIINQISRRDSGLYTCFSKNNMGNVTGEIR